MAMVNGRPIDHGHQPSAISHQPSAISPQPLAISPQPLEVALLCVATLIPRKGHDLLFRALASIPHRNWRLICAGSTERDPATVERLRAQLEADGIDDRVELVGDLDAARLAVQYDRADVFVLPTLHEGYGMAVAEALARGLPVVSTATGAIKELVGIHDDGGHANTGGVPSQPDRPANTGSARLQPGRPAGVVVPPGDLNALTAALSASGVFMTRRSPNLSRSPTWDDAVAAMERVLERVARP